MTEPSTNPLHTTAARRVGHRIFGPLFPYLLHLRPVEWPVVAGHTLLGWLLARPVAGSDGELLLGLLLWVVALNGGTLAINSAFDRDDGDIAYLKSPPQPPRGLALFALALMLGGGGLTLLLPVTFRWLYGVSVLMSIAYSVPPLRFKAVAGVDWVINMVGFGTLTPWAGWTLSGLPLDLEHGLLFWGFCPLFAALYPLTQIYQIDADRERGDRTLVLQIGVRRSLNLAIALSLLAFCSFVAAGWVGGQWSGDVNGGMRLALIILAGAAWLAVLLPWRRAAHQWTAAQHQRGMYHALGAWALTDVAIALAWLA